jgi:tRNA dimethylallyltransferase
VDTPQHGRFGSSLYARPMTHSVSVAAPTILLMGPTAAGKTDLALELVAEFPVEIVSVDSAMVYRGLDIGSGKPARDTLKSAPHHLVDILDPSERYSAGQFVRDARRLINEIRARGNVPLFVGGTMLYFKALTQGIADLPEADAAVRAELGARGANIGWPAMHAELAQVDPIAAQKILPNDAQRIQRALEVHRLTGKPLSELHAAALRQSLNDDSLALAWSPANRAALYDRIATRFDRMMAAGFLEEVRRLRERADLSPELPALRSVGYRQLWGYLGGEYDLAEAVRLGVIATRHLARRQLIWLRAMPEINWFDSLESAASDRIKTRIENYIATKL